MGPKFSQSKEELSLLGTEDFTVLWQPYWNSHGFFRKGAVDFSWKLPRSAVRTEDIDKGQPGKAVGWESTFVKTMDWFMIIYVKHSWGTSRTM